MTGGDADGHDPATSGEALIRGLEDRLPAAVAVRGSRESDTAEVGSAVESYTAVLPQGAKADSGPEGPIRGVSRGGPIPEGDDDAVTFGAGGE
ncbi:hypothetical protein [Halostreptopolyspora alba]